ncbi:hypothetical protein LJC07_08585 [Christensenellaceae bacterium OttesenSCG-928-L17]|nr:hypothetical protein [Christensenellaceae bacterium OttesenSCG-928-L17]
MYTINYHTGEGNESFKTIEECMENVSPSYTQEPITIDNENGEPLYISRWYPCTYNPETSDAEPLAIYSGRGFFTNWEEV